MNEPRPLEQVTPVRIRRVDPGHIEIEWRDGHLSEYTTRYLRGNCACAYCVDERTGKRLITIDQIPTDISYSNVGLVGNYAMQLRFSDGHDTGIYSWDLLRAVCPCESCR